MEEAGPYTHGDGKSKEYCRYTVELRDHGLRWMIPQIDRTFSRLYIRNETDLWKESLRRLQESFSHLSVDPISILQHHAIAIWVFEGTSVRFPI
jgi:hypothetical protein